MFAASPILSQAVTPSQLDAAAQHPPAASNASTDQAAETLFQSLSSTPQAPHASPAETQQSEQVEPSAYSVFAKPTAKANTKAAAKAATKTAAKGESDGDDVELSPEELGFAGHSEDAFAALKAKMADAQGKKSKKKDKKEAAAAATATTAAAAAAPMPTTAAADSAAVPVPSAEAETAKSLADTGILVLPLQSHACISCL